MSLEIRGAWHPATAAELDRVPVTTGVYEVARPDGTVVDLGYAGSRELFGLRSRIREVTAEVGGDLRFRFEQHIQYRSRHVELLLVHRHRHGDLPERVLAREGPVRGRLTPS